MLDEDEIWKKWSYHAKHEIVRLAKAYEKADEGIRALEKTVQSLVDQNISERLGSVENNLSNLIGKASIIGAATGSIITFIIIIVLGKLQ